MDSASSIPFPPKPTDIGEEAASSHVPNALFNFLAWLLLGDSTSLSDCLSLQDRVEVPSAADRRHFLSVTQAIIHCVTHGRVKTVKNVGLPFAIKHLSRSIKVVSLMNWLGHGLSATQVQEAEAGMAQQLLDKRTPVLTQMSLFHRRFNQNLLYSFAWTTMTS